MAGRNRDRNGNLCSVKMVGGQGTEIEDITEGMQDKFEDLLDE